MSTIVTSCHKLSNLFFNRSNIHDLIHKAINRNKWNKRAANPKVQKKLEMPENTTEDDTIEEEEWEKIAESESDFMNVHLSYREHEREMAKSQHMTRVKLLEKKYFKQNKEPSLLTWEEREQISLLHKMDPQKWNVHTLAASFPVTENVIEKILKAKWRPSSIERINMYNESVEKNWKMLYEGKLEISPEAQSHLAKFSSRKKIMLHPVESDMVATSEINLQPISREFFDIVNSAEPTKLLPDPAQNIKESFARSLHNTPENETYVIDEDKMKQPKTLSTLDMYRKMILRSYKSLDAVDKAIVDGYNPNLSQNDDLIKLVSPNDFVVKNYDKQTIELESKASAFQERINIPNHLKRKGSLFKLNDCYYDEDGELLYRVPGMG